MNGKPIKSCLPGIIVFAFSLGVYLPFLPSELSWVNFGSDGGDFLAAILRGGIPHPTGYPSYLLASSIFMQFPVGTPVWRVALLSACATAAAVALFCAWIQGKFLSSGLPARPAALISIAMGLSLCFASILFSQAVIVEVYGFQSLFVVLTIWWIDQLSQASEHHYDWRAPSFFALLYGFGLGNHVTGILAFPPVLFFLFKGVRKRKWRWTLLQLAAISIGISVYIVLPLRAIQTPPINWGDPKTLDGFLWLVSGKPYQNLLFQIQPIKFIERISAQAALLVQQFGVLGVLFGAIGVIQRPFIQRNLQGSLIYLAVVYSLFAIGYATNDSSAYLIPFFIVWAIWISLGIGFTYSFRWRRIPLGLIASILYFVLIIIQVPATMREYNPRKDITAGQYAAQYLAEAPLNAILLTTSDLDTFPLWYKHFGLKVRPDVRIIVLPLTQFAWYRESLAHSYPDLIVPSQEISESGWAEQIPFFNPDRPICRSRIDLQSDSVVLFQCDKK